MTSSTGRRWVVVGGGIAGLLAARRLAGACHTVMLLERDNTLGGRVSRVEVAGLTFDAGAESFATRGDAVQRLCEELGLGDLIAEPATSPAWVIAPGRAYPLPATGWLGIPLRPLAADVRRVLGWWGAIRACADLVLPTGSIGDDATAGSLAAARLGGRAADRLLAAVMSGVYSRPLDADGVVLAVPRHLAAPLLGETPEEARHVAIVVMVVDAPALDRAPRGTGVLVRPGVTRAKALTHASAKWPWLAATLPPGRHVIRLSYAVTPGEDVTGYAVADAARLLGVTLRDEDVVGIASSEWPDASPASVASREPMKGVHLVGSAAGLSGLAAMVAADAASDFS